MKYKVVSLFSGCGGMDLGLIGGFDFLGKRYKKLNYQIIQAFDIDKKAAEIYNSNFKHSCKVKDITEVSEDDILEHDVLLGGFPCQSFSIVAQNPKRLGYKDSKGKLFFEMCRILRSKKPSVFIAENVKGILSANKGEAFQLILNEFKNSGYHVTYKVINSAKYGVPQRRERVFIVGFKDINAFNLFQFPNEQFSNKPRTLQLVLEKDNEIDEKYFFSDKAVEGLKKSKSRALMNKGRAQKIDEPCNTVGAHLAKVSLNSTDPVIITNGRYRMFTPREVARIQSFPEEFILTKSRIVNYRALGNAVPPVTMWHISNAVYNALELHKKLIVNESMNGDKF
jgi:DNA (cytosine-5)-methyltransferase 1